MPVVNLTFPGDIVVTGDFGLHSLSGLNWSQLRSRRRI